MIKKILLIVAPLALAVIVFAVVVSVVSKNEGKGALQVTAQPKAQVFLDGKAIGQTPLCKCEAIDMIASGDHTIRLVPSDASLSLFEEKIKITKLVLTVVDRTFGKGLTSEGSVITLSPLSAKQNPQLLILSSPQGALVFLDSNQIGQTPLLEQGITDSDHELKIKKDGYKEKIIRVRSVAGYKLEALISLGVDLDITPTPTAFPTPQASPSAKQATILIVQTPTGFLRVRETGSLDAPEISRVYPGETYVLLDEKNGWYQIQLPNGKAGWITNQYAKKQ